jgi:predicted DNA-binding transcriptional regulator YafY
MSIKKYAKRMLKMNELIHNKRTGNTELFAKKIGFTKRQLLNEIKDIKDMGIPVEFDRILQSYTYTRNQGLEGLFKRPLNYEKVME